MPSPREVELKLTVPDGLGTVISQLLQDRSKHPCQHRYEVTTYFDTSDRSLAAAGLSLRVRSGGDRRRQTVKATDRLAVAADRAEWEWDVPGDEPDLSLLRQTPVAVAVSDDAGFRPAFRTEIDRSTWQLDLDGAVVEAALDEGRIAAGDAECAVRELELELREGDPAALFRLALQLHDAVPLHVEPLSKATRGWLLTENARPKPVKAVEAELTPELPVGRAFRDIAAAELGHLLANRPAALDGLAEGVHQMRVAVRRLRAALTLFETHLEPHATAFFQQELRGLGQTLGDVRDWDVFCEALLPATLQESGAAGWQDMLTEPAEAARDEARRRCNDAVQAPHFTALVLGLAAWAETIAAPGDRDLQQPVGKAGPPLLDHMAHKVAKRGRHLARLSEVELHGLRKALKKLRYGVDFLRPVLPEEKVKQFLKRCKTLQETLGEINDTVAGTALAEQLTTKAGPGLVPAASVLAAELGRRRLRILPQLHRQWDEFRDEQYR